MYLCASSIVFVVFRERKYKGEGDGKEKRIKRQEKHVDDDRQKNKCIDHLTVDIRLVSIITSIQTSRLPIDLCLFSFFFYPFIWKLL